MPDVQEVFRIATEKVRPDPGFLERQARRERHRSRNRKVGAFAVVAAVVIGLLTVALTSIPGHHASPATPIPTSSAGPSPTTDSVSAFVDVTTGRTIPLPDTIATAGFVYPVSPDGTSFTYTTCCDHPDIDVYVSKVDGTQIRLLAAGDAYGPQWSPDGSRIVFHKHDDRIGDVYVVDVRSGDLQRVTNLPQIAAVGGWWFTAPIFAPDGDTILFHLPRYTEQGYMWDLWSVPSGGGEETLVRRDAGFGSYSPDGRSLAYLSGIDANHFDGETLWVVGVDGGSPRALARGGGIAWPRWSPDGTRIAYAHGGHVYVVDVDTGVSTTVVPGGVAEWFDNSTLVVGDGN